MAPRGGRGGGGGGGSGSSSSSCGRSSTYPCSTDMVFMYGSRFTTYYSNSEVYGSLVLYAIWTIAMVAAFIQLRKIKAGFLRSAIGLYAISFIFLIVRFALFPGFSSVPVAYRYESSIVVILQRLAMPALLAAVFRELEPGKISKLVFWPGWLIYTGLNIAYAVYDFIISSQAINEFKDTWEWWLADRDFGLTYTGNMIKVMKTSATGSSLSPSYIKGRTLFDEDDATQTLHDRGLQVKLGVAADVVALALALFIAVMVGLTWIKRKRNLVVPNTVWFATAALGLLLSTIFRVIVATHYVLWNWGIVQDWRKWINWVLNYAEFEDLQDIVPTTGFLDGYRATVDGFPIVQALLEPLGIVIAVAAIVVCMRGRLKEAGIQTGGYKG